METKRNNWDHDNKQIQWDDFDAESYQKHYFGGRLEPEDRWAALSLASKLRSKIRPGAIERSADIGTGSSLVFPLTIAPYVKHIDLIEPGIQNVKYLTSILSSDREKIEADWGPTIRHLQEFDSTIYRNVFEDLINKAEVHHGFAQDVVEKEAYDGITMGFCAGSNSNKPDETAMFMDAIFQSGKRGAVYAATHTVNSEPYPDWSTKQGDVDMAKFPSLKEGEDWYADRYRGTGIELSRSPMAEMRPGYDGTLLTLGSGSIEDLIPNHYWAEKHRALSVEADYRVLEIVNMSDAVNATFTENNQFMDRYECRLLDDSILSMARQTVIYNDTVAIYHWRENQKVGVEIINREYAEMMRSIFWNYWKLSRPFKK